MYFILANFVDTNFTESHLILNLKSLRWSLILAKLSLLSTRSYVEYSKVTFTAKQVPHAGGLLIYSQLPYSKSRLHRNPYIGFLQLPLIVTFCRLYRFGQNNGQFTKVDVRFKASKIRVPAARGSLTETRRIYVWYGTICYPSSATGFSSIKYVSRNSTAYGLLLEPN